MNITISVKTDVRGLETIMSNCVTMPPQIVAQAGLKCAGYAKTFAPVDTGFLMNTIDSHMISDTTARIQSEAEYAIYQELGTYKMAAHPFLAPAVEQIAGEFLSPQTWAPLINT
jgi:HK97 gp10 family phage protein